MIIVDCEQYTPEWWAARLGIPTASKFSKIIGTKGNLSASSTKYAMLLAGERKTGKPADTYQSADMRRGSKLEPEARAMYGFLNDVDVREVGLCYKDESQNVSCSPDGLLPDGGLEIKAPKMETHLEWFFEGKLPTKHFCQVQGSMYVTGYDWWDFFSYYPGLDPLQVRVERDPIFIGKLHKAITEFNKKLDEIYKKLMGGRG